MKNKLNPSQQPSNKLRLIKISFYVAIGLSALGIGIWIFLSTHSTNITQKRKSTYPISAIFLNRRSSREMSNESITKEELMPLFEAARWSPSGYNDQPWRFIYAYKGTPAWENFFNLIVPANQSRVKNAGVLAILISKKTLDRTGKPSFTHSFDAGAAWMSLALQASMNGLVTRAIGGFDYNKAREILNIPDEFKIEIMIAIGKDNTQEMAPVKSKSYEASLDRKPLKEIIFENTFE